MKISQSPIKNVSTGNVSGILVARKDGEEIKDIAIFNGRSEDANIELMKKLKNFAASEIAKENNVSPSFSKKDFKEVTVMTAKALGTATGVIGGTAAYVALAFHASSSPSINSVLMNATLAQGPVARVACLVIVAAMVGLPLLGGYVGSKLSEKAARHVLHAEVAK